MYALSDDFLRELIDPGAGCSVEYCLIGIEGPYLGERSHREAISLAMERFLADCEDAWQDASRATARPVPASRVLELPEAVLQGKSIPNPPGTLGSPIPYWYAFLCPPHGCRLTAQDFLRVNAALFPNGTKPLLAFEWSADWSSYFEDGAEWWGTLCVSIYDESLGRFVVLMASDTD